MRKAGGNVIGVDWRIPLDEAWAIVGHDRRRAGNLDPVALFAPLHEIERRVEDILRRAGGRPGHIFNLGHGILPTTRSIMWPRRSTWSTNSASDHCTAPLHVRVTPPIAVLLMAMGGPDSLENVEPFLLDVRGGRPTPPELVEEIRERYRATGGKSPAVGITRSWPRNSSSD